MRVTVLWVGKLPLRGRREVLACVVRDGDLLHAHSDRGFLPMSAGGAGAQEAG